MPNTVRIGTQVTGVGKSSSDLDKLRDKFDKLQKQGTKGFAIGVGAAVTTAGLNLMGNAASMAADFIGDSVQAASAMNETLSKSKVIFGDSAAMIDDFGDSAAKAMGLSKQAAVEAAATFGNLFTGLDIGQSKAAEMSKSLVTLAGDLASFNNLDPTETLQKLRSGLAGEAEPLRSLGIFLSEAKVKAKAAELGLADAHGELSEGAKVLARYQLILNETGTAQGDFARTSDGLANSQRVLNAEFENSKAKLGETLLPTVNDATKSGIELIGMFTDLGTVLGWAAQAATGTNATIDEQIALLEALKRQFPSLAGGLGDAILKLKGVEDAMSIVGSSWISAARESAKGADIIGSSWTSAARTTEQKAGEAGDAVDDFASRSKKAAHVVQKSLGDIADDFDATWSELSGAAEQAAEDIFGPLERRAELAANKLAQGAALGVMADPKSSKTDITAARAELLGLQKDFFTLTAEMAGRGELTAAELKKLNAALKAQLKTAANEEAVSILALIALLDRLEAKAHGVFPVAPRAGSGLPGGGGRAAGGPASGPTLVGERGPELLNLPTGTMVNPSAAAGLAAIPRGGGSGGGSDALLAEARLTNALLSRLTAQEPYAARPQTARGDLARQAAMMPGGRL